MADTVIADPPTGDHVSVVPAASATAEIAALREEMPQFLCGKYVIQSGSFYRFRSDVYVISFAGSGSRTPRLEWMQTTVKVIARHD